MSASTEALQWISAAERKPDADETVLIWTRATDMEEWYAGWWDGEVWRDAAHGGVIRSAHVTHWAQPMGPT